MSHQLSALSRQVGRVARGAGTVLARVLGVPDYDAYVRHMALKHKGVAPVRRDEFEREYLNDRYSRPGSRCC